ncbi:hypothetical protein HPB48_010564 [Haemaphysalis longicornis]|uniref:DDE-1 domain-containing protein n=1 Tax=Haemaphysalis longicornis TaxID=44386 RepID=A0A9J6H407_HAELO|nr:hypothetical protein HPB48_010564 [Haemaphysalis longicornis]
MRDLFADWLSEFDRDMQRQGRRVLLGMGNCSAHHVQTSLTAVTLLFLPPHTTSLVQPLDLGIIDAFKASYKPRFVERLVIAVDPPAANLPLRGSLCSAVEMVKAAWSEVTATCVRNCFRKASFVDTQPEAEPDASDGQSGGDLWQRVIDSDMVAMTSAGTISFVPMKMLSLRNRDQTRVSIIKCGGIVNVNR